MAFTAEEKFAPFEKKVWLATPTMHGEVNACQGDTVEIPEQSAAVSG